MRRPLLPVDPENRRLRLRVALNVVPSRDPHTTDTFDGHVKDGIGALGGKGRRSQELSVVRPRNDDAGEGPGVRAYAAVKTLGMDR